MKKSRLISFGGFILILALIVGCSIFNQSVSNQSAKEYSNGNMRAGSITTYGKPLFPYPNSSDPSVRHFYYLHPKTGGELYLYTTSDLNGHAFPISNIYVYDTVDEVWWYYLGTPVLTETDFKWCLPQKHLWAPDCYQNPHNGIYYLFVPAMDSNGVSRIGIATNNNPLTHFTALPNYLQGIEGYASDPGIFYDYYSASDYIVYNTGPAPYGTIAMAVLSLDYQSATQIELTINGAPDTYMEGPALGSFVGNTYCLYFAMYTNAPFNKECIAYATADKVTGPYTYQGVIMDPNAKEGSIQASIMWWNNHWSFYYHDNQGSSPGYNRKVCAEYLTINPDGTIPKIYRTTLGLTN